MAMTETDIKIIIAAELKKQGFDKAQKATNSLDKTFKRLGGTIASVFAAQKIIQFGKESVKAFIEDDKAVKRLILTYKNLGLAFEATQVNDFINKLQTTTGVADDKLRPALEVLTRSTLDYAKAQKLLGVALDVSAGTGYDLQTVSNALSKAYLGNLTQLARLNIGIGTAEAKTLDFDKALARIQMRFKGQSAAAAETYAGKINRLKIASDEAKETIGKGLVTALEILSRDTSIDGLTSQMDGFARSISSATIGLADLLKPLTTKSGSTGRSIKDDLVTAFFAPIQDLYTYLEKRGQLIQTMQNSAPSRGGAPGAQRLALENQRILEKQRKAQLALIAAQKKAELERLKREKEAQQLKRAGSIFDMENIQIVAAMQGKIDGEQRLRLVALLALNVGLADAAEKASLAVLALNAPALANLGVIMQTGDTIDTVIQKILVSQAKIALLDLGITNIPKAKNPFEAWDEIMKNIISQLDIIAAKIRSMPTVSGTPGGTTGGTTGGKIDTPGGTKLVESKIGGIPGAAISSLETHIQTLDVMRKEVGVSSALGIKLREQTDEYRDMITYGSEALGTVVDERTKRLAMAALAAGTIGVGSPFDPARFRMGENADLPAVNVYVQGSVISQQDLVETISDQLYNYQKAGKGLLVSSTAI